MQCKDIPDRPILEFLAQPHVTRSSGANWMELEGDDRSLPSNADWKGIRSLSVRHAMPVGVPDKLILGKMRKLIHRGVVDGCGCGCRGDFSITIKGLKEIK